MSRVRARSGLFASRTARVATLVLLQVVAIIWFFRVPYPDRYTASLFTQSAVGAEMRFAVVGDFGVAGRSAADVGKLIASWNPDFVLTVGDNNYPDGAASTIDANVGQYYHSYIAPYKGIYGQGAQINRFFPVLGNHDWNTAGAKPFLNYFTLPGNERYYDFVHGQIHFFAIDSDPNEPDGITATSVQGKWLQQKLAAAKEPWKIVYFHHPPYSSGDHGSVRDLQWPFSDWGASAVLSGHDHDYERIVLDGFPYFVDGLGGASIYNFNEPVPGSVVRYSGEYGAMLVSVGDLTMTYQFITRTGVIIDTYVACLEREWHPGEFSCMTPGNGGRSR